MQFWFYGALLGALASAVDLLSVEASIGQLEGEVAGDDPAGSTLLESKLQATRTRRMLLITEVVKNVGDWPASLEGGFEQGWFSPLTCAFTGFVSSSAGWYLVWPALSK